jgi:UDP-N-acetylmuramyl pentapeptide phosphotransferase/UDP-N-acetylglucosamine-1-phosphate transferase
VLILCAFLLSAFIVYFSIPTIVKVDRAKKFMDEPNKRKLHNESIPTLGGVAIFLGILIPIGILTNFSAHIEFQYVFISSLILFFIGLKDDILIIAPITKLGGQIVATLIIILLANFRFTSFHGFLGIYHVPFWISIITTLFVFLAIINGFNLIDGIDGLASGIGIICSLFFGVWFFMAGEYTYCIIAAAIIGSLIVFFIFNAFGKANKIFMGDTGSLIIGLFMAIFALKFNELNINQNIPCFIHAAPAVSFGILIVPLFDTLRVIIIRLIKKRPLFKPDKNHIHHKLIALGYSHFEATLLILSANLLIGILSLLLNHWSILGLGVLIFFLATFFSFLPEITYFIKQKQQQIFS